MQEKKKMRATPCTFSRNCLSLFLIEEGMTHEEHFLHTDMCLGIIRLVANTPTAQNQTLLRRLAETGNDDMPAEELIAWKDLYPIIDRLYNGFYTRLTQHFGSVLTDQEVQTCCLLCAGFSTKEIAVITRQAITTVYIRKSSSRQKMGMPEGADIVEWVKNLE